jgi:hypothetical protein
MVSNLNISGYPFLCVPIAEANFNDTAAIYVIICVASDGSWTPVDVGQSGQLGARLDSHDRSSCWYRNCTNGNLWACVYQMPGKDFSKDDRLKVEHLIRTNLNPSCGNR